MKRNLTDFSVLTFDCYGTLIDWETGIWNAFQPLLARSSTAVDRSALLADYAKIEHDLEARHPDMRYDDVLRGVHSGVAALHGLPADPALDDAFAASIAEWPAFGDSAASLKQLGAHYKLVILSNVHNAGIAASIDVLGAHFDAVYTAEDIGSYKPAEANFRYMLKRLAGDFGARESDVLHTAQSLFHDHAPANRLRLASAWIDRQRLADGGDWGATAAVADRPSVDFHYYSLAAMADDVRQAFA